MPFVDLVPSLVVEADGLIVPFIYGFPHCWSIGTIYEQGFAERACNWRKTAMPSIRTLLRTTLDRLDGKNATYIDLLGELLITACED
ncbi:hypothetical protein DSCO28_28380 [Desulfosarcina ovata subsp. sediminis]|uniref:Uncharacterized protein n=2 Tax=Desulfosarcina ovata TaxID=83564 RepID=A0A5K8AA66_9BACT|nr:hypothetical protein DSCO28_28380 [Desulfosarcina ovata subsp. sediminis]BBO89485.1 hypothetical protein DSCOOX_26650 [Desulfosarcina ovata subsp. ovata]